MAKSTIAPEALSSQEKSFKSRNLHVLSGYWEYQTTQKYFQKHGCVEPVPYMSVKGLWLREAGFTVGTTVTVEVQEGKLVFELVPSPSEPEPVPKKRQKRKNAR